MLNQAKPACERGANSGLINICLSPRTKPPPCTRMHVGNGPSPGGKNASSVNETSPILANSTSVLISPAGTGFAASSAQAKPGNATTQVNINGLKSALDK